MKKELLLTASIAMLVAISGQAFAHSVVARTEPKATSDRLSADAFDALDQANMPQMIVSDAYRYHGGPKSND